MSTSKTFNFTDRAIKALPDNPADAKGTEAEYTDSQVRGLKILVGKTGNKKFLLRYTHGGRKRAVSIGVFGVINVARARQLALEKKMMLVEGKDPKSERDQRTASPTLLEFVEQHYLPHARMNKKSAHTDQQRLEVHIIPVLGHKTLDEITRKMVQGFINRLREKKAASTVNRVIALLHRVYVLAELWDFTQHNPVKGVQKFKEPPPRQRFLSHEEIRNFFKAAEAEEAYNYYAAVYVRFLLLTGARRSEGLQAKWDEVQLTGDNPSWYIVTSHPIRTTSYRPI